VPLPPGAPWSPIPEQILGANTRTSPEMAREIALSEAQCHWERYWMDSLRRPGRVRAAAAGFDGIVDRMRAVPGMGEVAAASTRAAAAARARRHLAAAARPGGELPQAGGSATTLSLLDLALREDGRPAVALVLARPDPGTVPGEAEALAFQALVERAAAALSGAGPDPDPDAVASMVAGRDDLTATFQSGAPDRTAAVIRAAAAAQPPAAGSFLLVWRGAGRGGQNGSRSPPHGRRAGGPRRLPGALC
jgi:hypothetical protein